MPSWRRDTDAHLAQSSASLTHTPLRKVLLPRRVVVVMDTTYWGRKYGVMLFKDAITWRDLLWYFVKNETNALFAQGIAELEGMGYEIPAVVFDGRKGPPTDMLTRNDKESFYGMFAGWYAK